MKRQIKQLYRLAFARRQFYKLNKLLLECSLHGLGVHNWENDHLSGEGHFLSRVLQDYMPKDRAPVFVDVGANVGDYSAALRDKYPESRIVAVEPHVANVKRLSERLPNIETVNSALGSEVSELLLFDRSDCDGSSHASLYEEVITDLHGIPAVEHRVQMNTLDQLADDLQIGTIDLLKIDTEGHELEVLKGATKLLARNAVPLIHLEFNEMNLISRVFFRDIRHHLEGYRFYRLLPTSMIEIPELSVQSELFAYQNVICIRQDHAFQRLQVAG
jgi:FkbM family methyltransferase